MISQSVYRGSMLNETKRNESTKEAKPDTRKERTKSNIFEALDSIGSQRVGLHSFGLGDPIVSSLCRNCQVAEQKKEK